MNPLPTAKRIRLEQSDDTDCQKEVGNETTKFAKVLCQTNLITKSITYNEYFGVSLLIKKK